MRRGVRPRHCLDVEDADGAAVNVEGSGTLRLLAATMEASRRGGERDQEEAKRRYLEFMRRKKGRKESEARREALVDLCCSTASAAVVLSYLSPRSRFGDRHLPAGRPERAAAGCRAAMSWSRNGDPELNMISNLVDPDKICSDARLEREQAIKDDVGTVQIQQLDKGPFYGSPTYLESWKMVQEDGVPLLHC
ncbi:uncharacterized protein LOC120649875 isoform X2 [Panicum virgatum]|uniref:uncharacterized protein LOC120649875 isoform X2 n=1 Tax=Panicum virgatum TaxID=38727 RepID=UPI0019D538F4|nr:uncharacterized protein LOC120649875 isoform X2 [Panicum virgatum]